MRKVPPFLLLDAWRGMAALWVVMDHSSYRFMATEGNERYFHDPLYWVSSWGQLGVVAFFVISGYCIMGAAYSALAAGRGAGRYGFDRVRRIYPPYLAAFFLAIAVGFLINFAQSHHLLPPSNHSSGTHLAGGTPQFWLTNLLLVQMELGQTSFVMVAWSLCYEVVFYLLLGIMLIIAKAVSRNSTGARGVAVFQIGVSGLTAISLAWMLASPATCPFPLDRWYQFGLGALLFLVPAANPNVPAWSARIQLLLAAFFTLLLSLHPGIKDLSFRPGSQLQAATAVVFIALLCILRPLDARVAHHPVLRPLMWLGSFSYSLYLVHVTFIDFAEAGGRRLGFDQDWYRVTYFLQIGLSLLVGWCFYRLVERHFISTRQKKRVEEELTTPVISSAEALASRNKI